MNNQIPPSIGPPAINPLPPTSSEPDWKALIPTKLSPPLALKQFDSAIERFTSHYPIHSISGEIAKDLRQGLELRYEPGLPLTPPARAVGAALAQIKSTEGL